MNNFKEEAKVFWNKNKGKIIFGAKCLGVGFGIGFVRGMITMANASDRGIVSELSDKFDTLASKLPEHDPVAFLKKIDNDDLLLNELRRRYYNEIEVCTDDGIKGVIDIMKDVLDNHWRIEGYEC